MQLPRPSSLRLWVEIASCALISKYNENISLHVSIHENYALSFCFYIYMYFRSDFSPTCVYPYSDREPIWEGQIERIWLRTTFRYRRVVGRMAAIKCIGYGCVSPRERPTQEAGGVDYDGLMTRDINLYRTEMHNIYLRFKYDLQT